MYGNRGGGGGGRFGNQQGLLGNGNLMMGSQMSGMANMHLLSQGDGGGQRDLRGGGGGGLFQMNPSLGMRDVQQSGGFNMNSRMNMAPQGPDAVVNILVITLSSLITTVVSMIYLYNTVFTQNVM